LLDVIARSPETAGAWLDLALVWAHQGRWVEAQELLAATRTRFAPLPPAMRFVIQGLEVQIQQRHPVPERRQAAAPAEASAHRLVGLAWGHDSNANAGLHTDQLTLTLPAGPSVLTLSPDERQVGANFLRLSAQHQQSQQWPGLRLAWQAQAQWRHHATRSALDSQEYAGQLDLQPAQWPGVWSVILAGRSRGGASDELSAALQWQTAPLAHAQGCQWRQRLRLEAKHHDADADQDAQWWGYRLSRWCVDGARRSEIYAQYAQEDANAEGHLGGDSRQHTIGVKWSGRLTWRNTPIRWFGGLEYGLWRDRRSYSPLLAHGAKRSVRPRSWYLAVSTPMPWGDGAWQLGASLSGARARSNLAIADLRRHTAEISLWRSW
jgi:hypothetical protein